MRGSCIQFFLNFSLTFLLATFIFVFKKSFSVLLFLLLHSQMLSFILQVLTQEFCLIRSHNLLRQKTYVQLRDIHTAEPPAKECRVLASRYTVWGQLQERSYFSSTECLLLQFHIKKKLSLPHNYSNTVLSMKICSIWEEFYFLFVTALPPGSKLLQCFLCN